MEEINPLRWGIDVGATTGRIVAARGHGLDSILAREEFALTKQPEGDFGTDFTNLLAAGQRMHERGFGTPKSVGLAVAGKVSDDRTRLTGAGNLGHWVDQPIAQHLSDVFSCPVVLGNDAEAAGYAEALYGHGRNKRFWFVIWGSGIGGCFVDGEGETIHVYPSELGHLPVSFHAMRKCGCGQEGCLEAYCGGDALAEHHKKPTASLTTSEWQNAVEWMSIGMQSLTVAPLVSLIVFGGGVANKQPHLLDGVSRNLKKKLRIVPKVPQLTLSALGENAGVVGALELPRLNLG